MIEAKQYRMVAMRKLRCKDGILVSKGQSFDATAADARMLMLAKLARLAENTRSERDEIENAIIHGPVTKI